jgi:large conductance mechanosensitive channel
MFKEFREFAIKGNVVDMAVGIILGAAFTAVVTGLVDDLIMPPLGYLTGGLDFSDHYVVLRPGPGGGSYASLEAAREAGASVLAWGDFANRVLSFLLIALALFFIVRWINRLRRSDGPPAPNTKTCRYCKSNIDKDALRCPHCTSELEASK